MPYIIAPLDKVKGDGEWPEYQNVLRDLQNKAFERASSIWEGFEQGGLTPGNRQFGIAPFRKNDTAGDVSDSTPSGSYSFTKAISATGWQDIFNYTVRNNMIHAFAGFQFTDDVLRVTQLRFEIEDRRFAILDLQEAQAWTKFGIVLKTDELKELIAEPQERVLVRLYAESTGNQRVVPIGFMLYKNLNLILTEV